MEPGWPFGGRPKPRKPWSLWKAGRLMECEINALRDSAGEPLGHEIRVYVQGDFQDSRAHPAIDLAEAEAEERRRELVAAGWAERPPLPV